MTARKTLIVTACCAVIGAGALFWPVDTGRATPSPSLLARDGSLLRAYAAPDGQMRLPVSPEQVDPVFTRMLIAYEDRRFDYHVGIDPFSLARATYQFARSGNVVSGASTISMQVAKLLAPAPRTLPSKLAEMWRALRLEAQYSKAGILSLYFHLAPYGGNIAGVRAASLVYFNKEPARLTPDEAALLVILPQNPNRFRPDRFPKAAQAARQKVLQRLLDAQAITQTAYEAGINAPVPQKRTPLPRLAAHLADELYATRKQDAPWHSTLDAALQRQLEERVYRRLHDLAPRATIAALVVENRTRAVRAYVGSADYSATARAGQVDMVTAIRSPGSTLKPFAYGMAFQEGLAVPDTIIKDTQIRFGNYVPSNFNQGFTGDVTMRAALQNSLNIPAVKILHELGTQRFLARLSAGGAQFVLPEKKSDADLPVILGGLGARLWNMAQLYTALANDGMAHPIYVLEGEGGGAPYPLLSRNAARAVTGILTGAPLSMGVARGPGYAQLAVKTGTSYGYRDAWAMGYTPDFTIGIWAGRADGTPVPGQIGRGTAIPVLLDAFDALPATGKSWPSPDNAAGPVPARLRYWANDRVFSSAQVQAPSQLKIHYPVDESVFAYTQISTYGLKLAARGGTRPYQWYVNNTPVMPDADSGDFIWQPPSAGFYKLTVQDADNRTVSQRIRIE